MQYCPKCKVKVRGYKTECPLCQGRLTGEPENPVYPILRKRVSRISILRIVTFLTAVLEIVMLAARMLATHEIDAEAAWIPAVMIIGFVTWIDLVCALMLKGNILRMVTFEAYVAIVAVYIADRMTGSYGWAISWTIPIIFLALAIFTIVLGMASGAHLEDYLYYLVFDLLFSQLQWIPVLRETNRFMWPAVICMAAYLILAAAVFVFRFRDLKNASAKMWNF